MTVDLAQSLADIRSHIQQLNSKLLNPQQQMFVDHIENTTHSLTKLIDGVPDTDEAHIQILPILGDSFLQPLVAVYGYAKLLLDSPASFNDTTIDDPQRIYLEEIFHIGRNIQHYVESLQKQAFNYRLHARTQSQQAVDLIQLINDNIGIYRYWIHDQAVQLQAILTHDQMLVSAHPYHLNALIQHIITVIASELIEYGVIQVSAQNVSTSAELHIFCTGLQITNDHLITLFQKDGRYTYLKTLQQMNGEIDTSIQRGKGSTIIIRLRA